MTEILNSMTIPQNNEALASIFHRMADCYSYLGREERFRAIAYENVSKILYNMEDDIAIHAIYGHYRLWPCHFKNIV